MPHGTPTVRGLTYRTDLGYAVLDVLFDSYDTLLVGWFSDVLPGTVGTSATKKLDAGHRLLYTRQYQSSRSYDERLARATNSEPLTKKREFMPLNH